MDTVDEKVPSKGRRVRIGLFPKGGDSRNIENTKITPKTQQFEESRDVQEEVKGFEPAEVKDASEKKEKPQFFNRQELKERLRSVVLNAINTQDSSSLEEKVRIDLRKLKGFTQLRFICFKCKIGLSLLSRPIRPIAIVLKSFVHLKRVIKMPNTQDTYI